MFSSFCVKLALAAAGVVFGEIAFDLLPATPTITGTYHHDRGVPPQGLRQAFLGPNPPNLMRVMPPKGVRSEVLSSCAHNAPSSI